MRIAATRATIAHNRTANDVGDLAQAKRDHADSLDVMPGVV
uniref:Uncharacterized protein n=1 Tax=uncultured bacterium esnapd26 TaxID=1366607 RepID=S5TVE6_9BACT|nr:hypothetical protein [uncultured bacterium esnapd26]